MPVYNVTEHRGRRIKNRGIFGAESVEDALRISTMPPLITPSNISQWRYIDDGVGGGALVDPNDEDHCFRADPRREEADSEYVPEEYQD